MSIETRKLGFYYFEFKFYKSKDSFFFDKELFLKLLKWIKNEIPENERVYINQSSKKAMLLYEVDSYEKEDNELVKIKFASCKFNHCPNYISILTGKERKSDKRMEEGENEITHILCSLKKDGAKVVFEERKAGVGVRAVKNYLNSFLKKYLKEKDISPKFTLQYSILPSENFEEILDNKMKRVCSAELFIDKELLGADGLKIMDRDDVSMKQNVIIKCTVEKGKTLEKNLYKKIRNAIHSEGERVKRIRIFGKDENKSNILIDSELIKKIENVNAELNQTNGLVESFSLFEKMEEVLMVDEE